MELDEFEVGNGRAGPVGHGHAVAGGDVGIGGVEIDLAAAAGGQKHQAGGEGFHLAGLLVKDISAQAPDGAGIEQLAHFLGGDQINGDVVFKNLDVGLGGDGGEQGPLDFAAGHVLGVEDAALGMAAFPPQIQLAFAVDFALGELHPDFHQFGNARRPFLDDDADDVFVAQPGPGGQRITHMDFRGVLFAHDGGDAALGVIGVGLGAGFFGDNGDAPQRSDFQGEGKPGNPAAQNQEIKVFHALQSMEL
jgi:hypothetical protein